MINDRKSEWRASGGGKCWCQCSGLSTKSLLVLATVLPLSLLQAICLFLSLPLSCWTTTCEGLFFFGCTAALMISYQLRFVALLEDIYNNRICVTRTSCMIVFRNSIRGVRNWLYNSILSISASISSGGLTQSHCYYITDHYCCSGRNDRNFYLNEHRCW